MADNCPFLTAASMVGADMTTSPDDFLRQCMYTNCFLYDSGATKCGLKVRDVISASGDESGSLIAYLESVIGSPSDKDTSGGLNPNGGLSKLLNIAATHIHDQHIHKFTHNASDGFQTGSLGRKAQKFDSEQILAHIHDYHHHAISHPSDTNTVKDPLETLLGDEVWGVDMTSDLFPISIVSDLYGKDYSLKKLEEHVHESHLHQIDHEGTDFNPGVGAASGSASGGAAALANEYYNNQDLDKNGMIYGYDFIISDADPDKPKLLQKMEQAPDFTFDANTGLVLSFAGYTSSTNASDQATILLDEFSSATDGDDNGLVFGVDFMISTTDANIPQSLIDITTDPTWTLVEGVDPTFSWSFYLETLSYDVMCQKLVSEFTDGTNAEDYDGDGLIYGTDFAIDSASPSIPQALIDLKSDPNWTFDEGTGTVTIWLDYVFQRATL